MTASKTYEVEAVRSGNWWAITVPALDGVFSQARRLDQVEGRAREAISLMLGVGEEHVGDLEIHVVPPDSVAPLLSEMLDSEAAAAAANERAATLRQMVATQLRDDGLPMRDIGRLAGISHQRVSQILSELRRSG